MLITSQTTFSKANAAFRSKDYASAIALYEEVLHETFAEPLKNQILFSLKLANAHLLKQKNKNKLGEFLIKETHQLIRSSEHSKQWKSLGSDPNFILDSKNLFLKKNSWYQFSVEMITSKKKGVAKLYFDYGTGFHEHQSISLSFKSGVLVNRIFFIKDIPLTLRFDPKEGAGDFHLETIVIEPLDQEDARVGMLEYLIEINENAATNTKQFIWEKIKQQAAESGINPLVYLQEQYQASFSEKSQNLSYEKWIEEVETLSLPTPSEVAIKLKEMQHKPLISIVMPVYNTDETYLRACIDSVLAQSYPHWELCIADDKSSKLHVPQVLSEYETQDPRIKVVYRTQNGHISQTSNSALQIATGEFVALLDHDDVLPEHALYFMAQAINQHPDAQIFYSDEDKIDTKSRRFEPHFKSDWNPDLFFSQNYVSHLGVYKRELLNRINGFRAGFEGSQDQDLLLRCLPHVRHDQIIHIPRVLYHWRAVEGSTALASSEKSYTTEAGIKALRDYFASQGKTSVEVEAGLVPNTYRVKWPLPNPAPLVSLLIPTRDRKDITEVAVCSILEKTTYHNYEIIILDNGSVETETLEWFDAIQKQDSRVRVIRYDHPFNYSAINNFGVKYAKGSVIGLINNDVEVISPEWLTEMVSHACRHEIGCVGAKLYYADDTIQHAGVILGIGGVANHSHLKFQRSHPGYFSRLTSIQNYSAVTAACLLIRKEIYLMVGGLNETDLKIAFNDVDFCLKVREAGYRNLWTPYAELYHHESISRGYDDTPEKQARFRKEVEHMQAKWGDALKQDPYYNPNLTKDREDFSLC